MSLLKPPMGGFSLDQKIHYELTVTLSKSYEVNRGAY